MILRDEKGGVIFASYRKLFHCNEALEVELQYMMEGLKLSLEHTNSTILLQSDCAMALKTISEASIDSSAYGHLVSEIKSYFSTRVVIPVKIIREQNRVAHCLTNYDRCGDSIAC
uniref:RNase H type-1 domain-containing protein n=1 Tax=Hordeum vulgare subsp. vulgare TaxID=112509 RepID=A0A8I7B3P7_HORVV